MVSSNGYANGIVQQTEESASGTGNLNLVSLAQFLDLNDEYSTGGSDVFKYFIRDKSTGEQEFGTGHLVDSSTLARDTVLWSTNSNNLVDFGSGIKLITQEPAVNSSGDFVFGSSEFQQVTSKKSSGINFIAIDTINSVQTELSSGDTVGIIGTRTDHGLNFRINSTVQLQLNTSGDLDFRTNSAINLSKTEFEDASGDGNVWNIKPRGGGSDGLEIEYGNGTQYRFDGNGSRLFTKQSWATDTGPNAVINSKNNLVQDTGSSRRVKSEIQPAEISMDDILSLEPKHFFHEQTDRMEYGLIAEEVHDIGGFEQYVTEDSEGRVSGLRYGRMVTLCISAIKDLQNQINELEAA